MSDLVCSECGILLVYMSDLRCCSCGGVLRSLYCPRCDEVVLDSTCEHLVLLEAILDEARFNGEYDE